MRASWALVTGPTSEPISLQEAKDHARINQNNGDVVLYRFIKAAREAAENYMARALVTQTWQLTLDDWNDIIFLPRAAPLQSVTSVKYYDTAGVLQTLSPTVYTVDLMSRPGSLARATSQQWPSLQSPRYSGRIEIVYVAGWANAAAVPERIKQGLRMHVAYMDSDREGMEDGERALKAAEACWDDRVEWIEPQCWAEQYTR